MEMEEESLCLKIYGEEDFYENIEAPKFVDLNAPDHYHPGDDRYWFCLRAGCDQKHEEEMDSEAIYKKFVLRVMAARSPNIRLRKAMYRKDSGANIKCPQTVPAKSSKSRGSRLALISSISKRMVDPKMEAKPLAKRNATPNVREKQSSVVSKALTTPRNKKRLSNPGAFRSVRNPKAMDIANSRVKTTAGKRGAGTNLSDIEIHEKSRNTSQGVCSTAQCDEGNNAHEGPLTTATIKPSMVENKAEALSDDKENDSEAMESDNKENASASDDNRDMELDIGHLKRRTPGKHESVKSTQMIAKAMRKTSKENFVTDATGVQGLKHGKPKSTNPKPFRLRTDERGILKEATLEKKLHAAPLKEIMSVTRFPGGSLQKKPNALLRNDKSLEQTKLANDAQKACEEERNTTQKKQHVRLSIFEAQNKVKKKSLGFPWFLKNSKERVRLELSSAPQRHTVSSQQKLVSPLKKYSQGKKTGQNSGNTLKRVKPPCVRNVARSQETSSTTKETFTITLPGQLGVIKEESPEILLRPKEVAKPSKSSACPETKASAAPRQSLQGRRSTTIPKEPNFHTIHTPKSCTRRVPQVIF
ncbi:hypothetical protein DKX38_014175 [Salix brachista]|uniref:Uncharacterized protein n=1 Tax=Salix brachista TaxID=2182728 RepID=A0A5N5LGM3_9ROSI|nr:hypothetical protein DKX38_014175 [Salix brachista]